MTNARLFLIHYHEIGLKGKNRGKFEQRLQRNIDRSLKNVPRGAVRRLHGRMILELTPESPLDVIRERLSQVFGVANFSEAVTVDRNIEALRETAWALAQKAEFKSFRMSTRRSDKSFFMTSEEINRDVGAYVKERSGAQVKMKGADLEIYIELAASRFFVYAEKVSAPGGLPVDANERAMSLISSGIDSPVASYKIMKRGVHLTYVHFHSQPYTDRNSQRNTEELVNILNRYQYVSDLYLVPFVEIQRHIMTHTLESYRVILYRRCMVRIAAALAEKANCQALVTGDNVGQVASQTLANMRAIEEVTLMPILRPLAGDNKEEIIDVARKIGTYEVSIEPYEDCCSVFVPKHPETKAKLDMVHKIEAQLDLDAMIAQTLEQVELKTFKL
ncbi:MAG: thiamine biosynthesis protein ThiI [Candidatus Latescibacterota bacterium]|jgi:thiamine biosynthesis protein ThiI